MVASGDPFGARIGTQREAWIVLPFGGSLRPWFGPSRLLGSFVASPRSGGAGRAFDMNRKYSQFGALVREAREGRKRYQIEVARKVGVSGSFLRRVELGQSLPSLMLLAMLWRLLRFDMNVLFEALGVKARAIPAALHGRRSVSMPVRLAQGRHARFGGLIARERVLAGVTQEGLAHALGIGARFLSRIEAGLQLPSVLVAAKLRDALSLDGNELIAALVDDTPREPFQAFGRILEVARERCELRPVDVANAAQCSTQVYEDWERGRALPSVRGLARVRRALRFNGNAALRAVWLADSTGQEAA